MTAPIVTAPWHSCVAAGCDVALNGVALADVEIYVVGRDGAPGEFFQTVKSGDRMPRGPMAELMPWERPFTRRKVA